MAWIDDLQGQVVGLDAAQLATAISAGATSFLTNDARLARVRDVRVLVLAELD